MSEELERFRGLTKSKDEMVFELTFPDVKPVTGKFYSARVVTALRAENTRQKNRYKDALACNSTLVEKVENLEALLGEVWAKTESYRARMDYHMMLRGESKKAYEELKERVERALEGAEVPARSEKASDLAGLAESAREQLATPLQKNARKDKPQ